MSSRLIGSHTHAKAICLASCHLAQLSLVSASNKQIQYQWETWHPQADREFFKPGNIVVQDPRSTAFGLLQYLVFKCRNWHWHIASALASRTCALHQPFWLTCRNANASAEASLPPESRMPCALESLQLTVRKQLQLSVCGIQMRQTHLCPVWLPCRGCHP